MIKLIIWIVIGILALSFFGISLRTLVLSPAAQDNFHFASQLMASAWDSFIIWINGLGASLQHLLP